MAYFCICMHVIVATHQGDGDKCLVFRTLSSDGGMQLKRLLDLANKKLKCSSPRLTQQENGGRSIFDIKTEKSSSEIYFSYYGMIMHQQNMLQVRSR